MTSAEKLYKKWLKNLPTEASVQDVKKILNYYFPGEWKHKSGSHIVVHSERLKRYNSLGVLTIPVKSGRRVKKVYIAKLIEAIQFIY